MDLALVFAGSRRTGTLEGIAGVTPVAGDLAAPDGPSSLVGRALDERIAGRWRSL
jgi:hypothetical protein